MSGLLLVLLGVWGGLIPFIGPSFHYAYTPANSWHYTTGRLYLEILPAAGAVLGGLIVMGSANRAMASFGGWIAALSGAWFVVGVPLSAIWGSPTVGSPTGDTTRQVLEYVGFFGGLGAAIVFFAALALGRFTVVGAREVRDAEMAAQAADAEAANPPPFTAPGAPASRMRQQEPATQRGFTWRHGGSSESSERVEPRG